METQAQRFVRLVNESVERMRAKEAVAGPKRTKKILEAIAASRRRG